MSLVHCSSGMILGSANTTGIVMILYVYACVMLCVLTQQALVNFLPIWWFLKKPVLNDPVIAMLVTPKVEHREEVLLICTENLSVRFILFYSLVHVPECVSFTISSKVIPTCSKKLSVKCQVPQEQFFSV